MLDIRTMFAMLVLSCFVAGIGVLGLRVSDERRASTRRWALGNLLAGCGLLLMGLRDVIPLWPSVVLGNTLMLCGFMLFYQAICLLVQKSFNVRLHVLASLFFFFIFHWLVEYNLSPRYLIVVSSGIMAVVFTGIMLSLRHLQSPHINGPRLTMVGLYLIAAVAALVRALHSAFSSDGAVTLFEPTQVQMLSFVAFYFALIGAGLAYMLMQSGLAYRDLANLANNDMLTGVRNRRNFMEMAERDWALAQRMGRPLSLMMLDLDHFKNINDEFGHLTGDEALRRFGEILRNVVRNADLICRYGGEEFCIVMVDTDAEMARHSAERIRREFATLQMNVGGRRVPLSVSIGIAGLQPDDTRTLTQLLSAADKALYAAKAGGRNRVEVEALSS